GGAGDAEVASAPVPDVDVVLLRPGRDLVDALDRGAADLQGLRLAVHLAQQVELLPEPIEEPAVAPARASAADVLLEEDDVDRRVALLQEVGAPHAGVAASDDDDVGPLTSTERRSRLTRVRGERIPQPPAARGSRRDLRSG